jgi:hypothetical protein
MAERLTNVKLEKDIDGSSCGQTEVLSRSLERLRRTTEDLDQDSHVPAKIRFEHPPPNMSIERYRCANPVYRN